MAVPQTPDSEITIQSVVFEPDSMTITYAETADVHVAEGAPLIHTHVFTAARHGQVGEQIDQLDQDVQDLVVELTRLFDASPSIAEAQAAAGADADGGDDDEFRGMGE